MKNLKQIVHLFKGVKLKVSDLVLPGQNTDTKVYTFYQKILNGDFQTDEDAADFFYNSDINNSSYKNLKSTLRNRLVNSLIFFKPSPNLSEREKAYIFCSKYIAVTKTLIILNIRQVAIDFCHRILKKALHFEYTEYIIEVCYILRSHYALRVGSISKFEYYTELLETHIEIRKAEFIANTYYLKLLIPYIKNKSAKVETHQQAIKAHKKLSPYLQVYRSPYLYYIAYYIESLIHISVNDYIKTIEVCRNALAFFEHKDYVHVTATKAFLHQLTLCYTQLKMYEEGKEIIEKGNKLLRPGSYNWYINLNLYLTLAIHSKKYQEAYFAFNKAFNHKGFKKLNQGMQEKWQILQVYIYFLIHTDQIQAIRDDKRFTKFRMGKFLNSVPTFSKDKRGLNIPILVIQIVLTIVNKDHNTALNRIEAIEKYRSRYLRKDDNFRSNCFIKMLLQIPISGFHKAGIKRRAEKYFEQMKSVPLEVAKQANEIEIIPYEDLWEIILQALDNSFYKPRK